MDRADLYCAVLRSAVRIGCVVSDWNVRSTNIHAIFGV